MKTLVCGGACDVLHSNHKSFISDLINLTNPDRVLVRLKSNKTINESRKRQGPLFDISWRIKDVESYLINEHPNLKIEVHEVSETNKWDIKNWLNNPDYVIAVKQGYNLDVFRKQFNLTEINNIVSITEKEGRHTSDIYKLLREAEEISKCNYLKVGAVLIRDGEIVCSGWNGVVKRGHISSFSSLEEYGKPCQKCNKDMSKSCEYLHAEEIVLDWSKAGDDLIVSYSPCIHCAKDLVNRGIRRVVYFQEFYESEGIDILRQAGIEIRKAGV